MGAWTNATLVQRTATDAGVLRPADGSGITPVYRPPAGPAVADYVQRYWSVDWSTDKPEQRSVLTHPTFHLAVTTTVDGGRPACQAVVHGVVTSTFSAQLRGRGRVVGAKFRPGGFAALTGRNAYCFTDRDPTSVSLDSTASWPRSNNREEGTGR